MAKTSTISTQIDPDLKIKAEKILTQLGLSTTQAIILFLKQVELQKGLPFQIKIPNKTTINAIEESKHIEKMEHFEDINGLYKDMGI